MRKVILSLLTFYVLTNTAVNALTLEQARSQGLVCEGTNGLLTPVGSATGEVRSFIDSINATRTEEYQKIQQNEPGSTLQLVMSTAAKEIISSVPAGTYIMDNNGNCRPK